MKILISGYFGLFPVGRHAISFLGCLLKNPENEVYINTDFITDDARHVFDLFFKKEFEKGFVHMSSEKPEDFVYDFNVFPSPLPPIGVAWTDLDKFNKRKAKTKVCYPVFDGSVPLLEWIDVINRDFDLCLSPSGYCAHNLKRHGVTIPCFELECSVLMDDMLEIQPQYNPGRKYRFGCISANETRKNLPFLIKAFSASFSKDDNVELYVHSIQRPDVICTDELLTKTWEECEKRSNIILEKGFKNHQQMLDLWKTFDAYICPQSVTGYFTTPAEAMACGIPCILSDIPVHRELTKYLPEKNNLFYVEHKYIATFYHGVFCYRNLGVKFDSEEEKYAQKLKDVYSFREKLLTPELIKQRKENIKALTISGLSKKYNDVFHSDAKKAIICREPIFQEEDSPVFQSIEKAAIESQKIYIECTKIANSVASASATELDLDIEQKYMAKIDKKVKKYNALSFLHFLSIQLSLYCKIKRLIIGKNKKIRF